MTLDDLEKFYGLGNVEGVALVNAAGQLTENQLFVSEEVAAAVGATFASIFAGLTSAGRSCRGFLVRTATKQFLGMRDHDGFVILQLDPAQEVDDYFKQAGSIIGAGMNTGVPATMPGQAVATQEAAAPVEDETAALWEEFSPSMVKALSKVAPQHLAKKILAESVQTICPDSQAPSSIPEILAVGQQAVEAVPNPGRRRLVEKELQIICERLKL